jgi:hypothetical protein
MLVTDKFESIWKEGRSEDSNSLRAGRSRGRISIPGRGKNFLHVVQTDSEVLPTSYPMGTGSCFPGLKWPGREADHSPPTSAEVKKMWIYTSTLPYAFMGQCLISYAQGKLYLTLFGEKMSQRPNLKY